MAVNPTTVAGDTALGAGIGTALGPGYGTAIGAAGGAIYGLASGLFGGGTATVAPSNPANFQLGQGNGSDYTNQIAAALANRGNSADATAAGMQAQGNAALSAAGAAQSTAAPQIAQDAADRQRQLAALGGTNAQAGQLAQLGANGMPMGLAAAQLAQGEDANMNQALALAHSGRTLGGGAANMQQAAFQNAQSNQVTNQQAATANIAEQQQNQQFKLNALGASGSLYGQAGTQAAGVNQTDLGVQQTNAGLQQTQGGINNQTTSTLGNIGLGLNSGALGQNQLGQGYQGQGIGVLNSQLTANENLGGANVGTGEFNAGQATAANTAGQATLAAGAQAIAQGLRQPAGAGATPTGNAAGASGQSSGPPPAPDFGTGTSVTPGGPTPSDRDVKTGITPANIAMALKPGGGAAPSPFLPGASALVGGARGYIMPGAPGSPGNGAPTAHYNDPNAMPSGAPTHLAPTLPPGMANSLAALGGGQPGAPGSSSSYGPASPVLPPGATGGDPYLAAIAGANNKYLPSGYWDPTVVMPPPNTVVGTISGGANPALDPTTVLQPAAPSAAGTNTPSLDAARLKQVSTAHASDVHSKTRIQQLESQLAALQPQQPDTASLDAAYRSQGGTPVAPPSVDLRPAQGYSYEYKDPAAHGQGRFFGPMAQDLEQTPAGASTVKQAPDGTKMVDTSRLALVNTSAISEQQRKLEALQRQLAALSPQADTLARGYPTQYPTTQAPY